MTEFDPTNGRTSPADDAQGDIEYLRAEVEQLEKAARDKLFEKMKADDTRNAAALALILAGDTSTAAQAVALEGRHRLEVLGPALAHGRSRGRRGSCRGAHAAQCRGPVAAASTGRAPPGLTSRCRCGPVTFPVAPTWPTTSPRLTDSPAVTWVLRWWQYHRSVPSRSLTIVL